MRKSNSGMKLGHSISNRFSHMSQVQKYPCLKPLSANFGQSDSQEQIRSIVHQSLDNQASISALITCSNFDSLIVAPKFANENNRCAKIGSKLALGEISSGA